MKKVLPVALSTALLLAGAALAEPPNAAASNEASVILDQRIQQLPEDDLAALAGGRWWSDACTAGLTMAGFVSLGISALTPNGVDDGISLGLIFGASRICA